MSNHVPRRALAPLRASLSFPLLAFLPLAAARADLDDQIGDATDRGIEFLIQAIEAKQVEHQEHRIGSIALETYALIVAGVSVEHPVIKKNLDTLNSASLDHTYSVACYAFALDAAISQLQGDAALATPSQKLRHDPSIGSAYRPRLEASITALLRIRRPNEGDWNYTANRERFDNSNTQFAVLGLGLSSKHNISVPREVWEEIALHFIQGQKRNGPEVAERPEFYPEEEKGEGKRDRLVVVDKAGQKVEKGRRKGKEDKARDGEKKEGSPTVARAPEDPKLPREVPPEKIPYFARGWDYDNKQGETWNMTCSGLSSLIICEENLRGKVAPDFHAQIQKAIRDGYAWLMSHWNLPGGEWGYYGLYSLEKVADLGEVKKFGAHDWYHEVAQSLISAQQGNGSWPGGEPHSVRWNTSFALLILNRATSLVTQGRQIKQGGKVAYTGANIRRDKDLSDDRNWVFLPEYDREFHIPSLLRQVKLRPTRALLRVVELAFKHYPEENRGLLVWNLAQAWEDQKQKPVRQWLEDQLVEITGTKYDTAERYQRWYKRWGHIHRIGVDQQDPDGLLKQYYTRTNKSLVLRKKLIWAVARCRDQSLAPQLMEDLAHSDADVRQAAYEALSLLRLSKEPIPSFDPKAEGPARDGQVALIREWYLKRKATT